MPDTLRRLIILFFVLQAVSLQIVPLWGSSEAREAHVVWEVANSDSKILPTRAGIIPSKPPMFHWISGTIYSLFDSVHPLIICRFVSLIGSIIFLLFSFRIGKLFGDQSGCSLIIILTSWLFLAQSTDAKVDMLFSGFVVGALYFGAHIILNKTFDIKRWIAAVFLLVLSVLCKGPLAIGLVGLLLATLMVATSTKTNTKQFLALFGGLIITLVIIAGLSSIWYLAAANLGGDAFVSRQLLFENLHRIIGHQKMNTQPWWFYLPSLLRTTFPWSLVLICILIVPMYRDKLEQKSKLSLLIFFVGVIALSIASGKRHSYPLPLLPFFAAGVSTVLHKIFNYNSMVKFAYVSIPLILVMACTGLTIKGRNKNYQNLANQIINSGKDAKITILKDEFDESLDPIMYFLREKLAPVNQVSEITDKNICLVSDTYFDYMSLLKLPDDQLLQKSKNYLLIKCSLIRMFTNQAV